jgi:hypothetical protein
MRMTAGTPQHLPTEVSGLSSVQQHLQAWPALTLSQETGQSAVVQSSSSSSSHIFSAPEPGQMGAHVDPSATAVFLLISAVFLAFRLKIGFAMQAQERRVAHEKTIQSIELLTLKGDVPMSQLQTALQRLDQLREDEERARTLNGPLGLTFRLFVPDVPGSQALPQRRRSGQTSGRDAEAKQVADSSSSSSAQEAPTSLSPLKLGVLGLVLLSQLWLLVVLSADPMAPPSQMFYSAFGSQS